MGAVIPGLTEAQERFCLEYAKSGNASAAYRIAYPKSKAKPETINEMASRLVAERKVSARISELRAATSEKTELTLERWAVEVKRLATVDARKLMHEDGRMKLPHELDDDTAAAIASFKFDPDGNIEYRFHSKNQALDMAAKHLGAYERDNEQKTDPLAEAIKSMLGAVIGPAPRIIEHDEDE